ncbi:MAG TPA: FAD-binding protein [Candidatus Methanofastidiosa archaeon]|nr:FAD-binding protein [Candidatus Methanofastidiosa archaeon]
MDAYQCDVLVIGSGGAGARAAIEASANGAEVLIVSKTMEGKAHTVMAEGGINAALAHRDPEDSIGEHFRDTVEEGVFLNNQKMAEILANETPKRVYDLEGYGAVFDRLDRRIAQRPFGGQSHPRTCYVGDCTGHEIIMTLVEEARRRCVDYHSEVFVTRLLKDSGDPGRIAGAFAVDFITGAYRTYLAKSVILATGGAGRVFKVTSNPHDSSGDGYALALRAGASLQDMEQTQFHPTGMVFPASARGILVTEAVRGEGGVLFNKDGERFMSRYNPEQMELSPRDQVARAIYTEIQEGRGTERGGVFLDITHRGEDFINEKLPRMVKQFKKFANVDITREPMQVAPTAHHFMGGVRVDPYTCENLEIKGLFACGEAAAGAHGANRLGGNALAETQVFGKRAGEAAAKSASCLAMPSISKEDIKAEKLRLEGPFSTEGERPQALVGELQEIMWKHAGIVRDEALLEEGLERVARLGARPVGVIAGRRYNVEWLDYMELSNMLLVSRAVMTSALARKESRGAHFRRDHPKRNDSTGLVNISISLDGEGMRVVTTPVDTTKLRPVMRRGD